MQKTERVTDEMVEAAAEAYWFEVYGRHRKQPGKWPECVYGGSDELFRAGCRAALTAALSSAEEKAVEVSESEAAHVAIPIPRGGLEQNWWEEWVKTTRAYNALAKAAQAVIDEAKAIHDNDPWPTRYRAPYEAITKLTAVLAASDKSAAVSLVDVPAVESEPVAWKVFFTGHCAPAPALFQTEDSARDYAASHEGSVLRPLFAHPPRSSLIQSEEGVSRVAPVDVYRVLRRAYDEGFLDRENLSRLSREIAALSTRKGSADGSASGTKGATV